MLWFITCRLARALYIVSLHKERVERDLAAISNNNGENLFPLFSPKPFRRMAVILEQIEGYQGGV
jgi:hypothetical protein